MKFAALYFLLLSPLVSSVRNSSTPVASQNSSIAKNSTAVSDKKQKKDDSADLEALDAAMEKLPASPVAAPVTPAKPAPKPAPKKTPPKPVATHVTPKAAPKKVAQALNVPSKEDVKLSDLAKKNKDFAIKDDADAVLEAGDALAEKQIKEKHRQELQKVAPAKVVHVDAPVAKTDDNENLESAKTLASDLEGLKERAAEQKAEKIEDQKRHERHMLKVKAIKDKRAQRQSQSAPKDKKKQRALNLDKLVKLTNEIKQKTSFVQQQAPVETHSTLEAHEGKLQEAQQEVDEMKANGKMSNATPAASDDKDKKEKSPEPPVPSTQPVAPSNPAHKITSASHHPENTEHLKNINEAVGHLSEEETPASVKEVQQVLEKAQAMTKAAKNSTVSQFTADPHEAKVRAKKFKNRMENHVDEMHQALHEHQKAVDTKVHLEKIRLQREAEAAERLKWEAEQARLEQLKIQAEKLQHEKEEKERTQAIENRTATEAAHKSFDPQAEFRARQMRTPQAAPPRSSAYNMGHCSLVFIAVAALFA